MVKNLKKIHKIRSRKFVQPNPGIRLIGGSPADFVRISGLDKNKLRAMNFIKTLILKLISEQKLELIFDSESREFHHVIFNPHKWTFSNICGLIKSTIFIFFNFDIFYVRYNFSRLLRHEYSPIYLTTFKIL